VGRGWFDRGPSGARGQPGGLAPAAVSAALLRDSISLLTAGSRLTDVVWSAGSIHEACAPTHLTTAVISKFRARRAREARNAFGAVPAYARYVCPPALGRYDALATLGVEDLPVRAVGYALTAGSSFAERPVTLRGATRALAHPAHALLPHFAAPDAAWRFATRAAALAHTLHALLSLCTLVEAAATVTLVGLEVYAPVVAAGLARRAGANLVTSTPDAILRAALRVPTTFASKTPAIIGPGHPWHGGQRGSQEGTTHQLQRFAP
jgi:hypothetical protein